jgi:hypothetical protein
MGVVVGGGQGGWRDRRDDSGLLSRAVCWASWLAHLPPLTLRQVRKKQRRADKVPGTAGDHQDPRGSAGHSSWISSAKDDSLRRRSVPVAPSWPAR